MIGSVTLSPSMPTRQDRLSAKVVSEIPDGSVQYRYTWKVNQRTVNEGEQNTLDLSPFQVRDTVSVVVTPYDDDQEGFAVESPVVAIHGAVPELTLKPVRQQITPGEPIRLQLSGYHPDGDRLTFSLEPPLTPGMVIDAASGKILFTPGADLKGTIQFGAAVEDSEGTRVSKVFEFGVTSEPDDAF